MTPKIFGARKYLVLKTLGPKEMWFTKIESHKNCVTAEIFLIWTDVARTNIDWKNVNLIVENVVWANVTVTVGICLCLTKKLYSMFHQNWVNNC